MPALSSDNPWVVIIAVLALILFGGTSGGFFVAARRDRRASRVDDAALLDQVRDLVREEVQHVSKQLRDERRRTARLERRVDQLTDTLRAHGLPIPDWPPAEAAPRNT